MIVTDFEISAVAFKIYYRIEAVKELISMIMKLTYGRQLHYKADESLTCALSTVMNRDKLKEALVEESSQSSLIVVSPSGKKR